MNETFLNTPATLECKLPPVVVHLLVEWKAQHGHLPFPADEATVPTVNHREKDVFWVFPGE